MWLNSKSGCIKIPRKNNLIINKKSPNCKVGDFLYVFLQRILALLFYFFPLLPTGAAFTRHVMATAVLTEPWNHVIRNAEVQDVLPEIQMTVQVVGSTTTLSSILVIVHPQVISMMGSMRTNTLIVLHLTKPVSNIPDIIFH